MNKYSVYCAKKNVLNGKKIKNYNRTNAFEGLQRYFVCGIFLFKDFKTSLRSPL
ncbi:hypothetical protein DWUX_911 [Desulfovibrio diazotrophicus]|nr:hypothetical protein DWUX_911 [Desulfovibrio diazotrophicus]VVU43148.1 hypothetical protein DWUX_494 [Desulfovibrio diazotrophicus]